MSVITQIAIIIVALLHVGFMILEMFLWSSPVGRKVFGLKQDFADKSATLAANQGLYNGFLAAGLVFGLCSGAAAQSILIFFLSCIIIAGAYGAITVSKSILLVQSLPAIIALMLLLYS